MKKETAIRIFCSLLILLFAYAGLSKLTNYNLFQKELQDFPFISTSANFIAWFIPLIELITVCLLFFSSTHLYGLYVSLILLLLFTGFLIFMLAFDKNLPCSCGGIISRLSWKQHIVFNLVFIMPSIAGIVLYKQLHKTNSSKTKNSFS